jgi:hypothetical protein
MKPSSHKKKCGKNNKKHCKSCTSGHCKCVRVKIEEGSSPTIHFKKEKEEKEKEEEEEKTEFQMDVEATRQRLAGIEAKIFNPDLICADPLQKPSKENKTGNYCPPFYKRLESGCCEAMTDMEKFKYRFKKSATLIVAVSRILTPWNKETITSFIENDLKDKDGKTATLPEEGRQALINDVIEQQKQLTQFEEEKAKKWGPQESAFILQLSKNIQKRFAIDAEDVIQWLLSFLPGDPNSMWKRLFGNAVLTSYQLMKIFLFNPATVKIMLFVAMRIKQHLCLSLSLKLSKQFPQWMTTPVQTKTFMENVKAQGDNAIKTVQQFLPEMFSNFAQSASFDNLVGGTFRFIGKASSNIPFVGGVFEGIGDIVASAAVEAARLEVEIMAYNANVSQAFTSFFALISLTNCIQKVEVQTDDDIVQTAPKKGKNTNTFHSLVDAPAFFCSRDQPHLLELFDFTNEMI